METKLQISGMSCAHCEQSIKKTLLQIKGVKSVSVSHQSGLAYIKSEAKLDTKQIDALLNPMGYGIKKEGFDVKQLLILLTGIALFVSFQMLYGRLSFQLDPSQISISLVVIYGLVSSLHCVSMCGGLALSANIGLKNDKIKQHIAHYQVGRIVSYTLTGLGLGYLGSWFEFSLSSQNTFKLMIGLWMVLLALQSFGFIKLPSFKFKFKNASNSLVIGLLNGLMPCGALQSIQLLALGSGDPLQGALMMLVFAITTAPALLGMQWFGLRLGKVNHKLVRAFSSFVILWMGLNMIAQYPIVSNTFQSIFSDKNQAPIIDGVQRVTLTIQEGRYVLDYNTIQEGIPVELSFDHTQFLGCANPIVLSFLDDQRVDVLKKPEPIVFTIEDEQTLRIHCWMDMDTINLYVI